MSALTVEVLEKFDHDSEMEALVCCVGNDYLYHEDNTNQISAIAERLQVDADVIYSYIWLKNLIEESDGEIGSYESAMAFADKCGINLDAFQDYLQSRRKSQVFDVSEFPLFQDTVAVDEEVAKKDLEDQEKEAFLAGMNLYEWREHIADLQADANLY